MEAVIAFQCQWFTSPVRDSILYVYLRGNRYEKIKAHAAEERKDFQYVTKQCEENFMLSQNKYNNQTT